MQIKEDVLKALRMVIHPEKGSDIVTLGMVGDITVSEEGIAIVLVPEKSNDPFLTSIKSHCVRAVKEVLGPDTVISSIEVKPRIVVEKMAAPKRDVLPGVKNIIAVSSGKGGVGKSTVAVNLAVALARQGYATGLLDADVFGPSVPRMFNAEDYRPEVRKENGIDLIIPMSRYGVKILSIGFFVKGSDAVIWRGPMASSFLKQLITQGDWGELDYLIFDLPPGTSDIHLTLVQEVPVTGAVVVTTPQEVALADARKGIAMFRSESINVPVLGLVENMSYFEAPELPGKRYYIFGKEGGSRLATEAGTDLLGEIPIVESICDGGDSGTPAALDDTTVGQAFMKLSKTIVSQVEKRNAAMAPTKRVEMK
ncbi:MAG: Mrp/NBP35 family ATP-binding protein [Bacteroidales bacterium]|jgi:ATP-binding protein involved in chromosome partitioning|nr:Mrp/NBP35 family ATP-binding protein [Bacteroidales bacterium]